MTPNPTNAEEQLSFTIQTIDCIACTPVFRRNLFKIRGVTEVKELPITNKIIVTYDAAQLDRARLQAEVITVSRKAGFGDKIIFWR